MIVVVVGFGRRGKDTVAEWLRDAAGLRFEKSTAMFAADIVFDQLKSELGYKTSEECFADRGNHRGRWDTIIAEFNGPDRLGLYREMLKTHDILCGIRRIEELKAVQKYHPVAATIWVDASKRHPADATCTIRSDDCDFLVDNNGDLADLYIRLTHLLPAILANDNVASSSQLSSTAV